MKFSIALLAALFFGPSVSCSAAQDNKPLQDRLGLHAATVRLQPIVHLRKGVDAWPLIAHPANAAELRVNASLQEMNHRLAQALRGCDDALALSPQSKDSAGQKIKDATGDWERRVTVAMQGPRFLSLIVSDEISFCGGNYPNREDIAVVFDLTTGELVRWDAFVAQSAEAQADSESTLDGSRQATLILPALEKLNTPAADDACKNVFKEKQSFLVWPDAQMGQLEAEATGLPHVVQGCVQKIRLSTKKARELGFNDDLLTAIEQAHQRIVVGKPNSKRH